MHCETLPDWPVSALILAMHKSVIFKFDGMHMHKILGSQNKKLSSSALTHAGISVSINACEYYLKLICCKQAQGSRMPSVHSKKNQVTEFSEAEGWLNSSHFIEIHS